jgi:hypothetical protein
MAAKAKDIRGAVRAGPDFAPLADATDIAINGLNRDVAPQRKAAVRPAGPRERARRCSR